MSSAKQITINCPCCLEEFIYEFYELKKKVVKRKVIKTDEEIEEERRQEEIYEKLIYETCGRVNRYGDICGERVCDGYEYCCECMEIDLGMCKENEYDSMRDNYEEQIENHIELIAETNNFTK